jgi:hypothetical protein
MTFDNDALTYVHLVSWPSIWLPPSGTIKIMALGFDQSRIEQISEAMAAKIDWANIAIYWVPDFDINNKEHIDWLVVNDHVPTAMVNGLDIAALTMALVLDKTRTLIVGQAPILDQVIEKHRWINVDVDSAWSHLISFESGEAE